MARKKFAKDPMLYIHQPQVERPQAPMQHQYISPKKAKEPTSVDELSKTSKNSSNPVRKKRNFLQRNLSRIETRLLKKRLYNLKKFKKMKQSLKRKKPRGEKQTSRL